MVKMLYSRFRKLNNSFRSWISKSVSLFLSTILVMTLSSILYILFHNIVIPESTLHTPLNFVFKDCGHQRCDHPAASVDLDDPMYNFHLKRGEQYEFIVDLKIPETQSNLDVGMFVINIELQSETTKKLEYTSERIYVMVNHAERKSAMMRYKSPLIKTISSVMFFPLIFYELWDEAQVVTTTLLHNYEQKPGAYLKSLKVSLESLKLNFYEAHLTVNVKLDGFRYYMCHYPLLSFVIGTPFFLCPIVALLIFFNAYVSYEPRSERRNVCSALSKSKPLMDSESCKTKELEVCTLEADEIKECDKIIDDKTLILKEEQLSEIDDSKEIETLESIKKIDLLSIDEENQSEPSTSGKSTSSGTSFEICDVKISDESSYMYDSEISEEVQRIVVAPCEKYKDA